MHAASVLCRGFGTPTMRSPPPEVPLLRRSSIIVAALLGLGLSRPASADLTAPLVAPVLAAAMDSANAADMATVIAARAAYEKAWAQREAGDNAGAYRTADEQIREIAPQLAGG